MSINYGEWSTAGLHNQIEIFRREMKTADIDSATRRDWREKIKRMEAELRRRAESVD